MKNFDYLIIGAGISGLIQATILAQEGAKVCILEAQKIPGGFLQTFSRKKYKFDTGFHYIGGTNPGKPLRKYLEYLGIFKNLPIQNYPKECFFEVSAGDKKLSIPSSFSDFIQKLKVCFPQDSKGIQSFYELVSGVTSSFSWYDLKAEKNYLSSAELSFPKLSISQWLNENLEDVWLKKLLGAFSFSLGLEPEEASIAAYSASFESIFDHPVWLQDGGDGLIKPLCERAKDLGVEIYLQSPVAQIHCEKRVAKFLSTQAGDTYTAQTFISTIHPKQTMKMLSDDALRPIFKERVLSSKDSRGSFGIYITLKKELSSIQPINYLRLVDKKKNGGLYSGFYFNSPSLLNKDDKPRLGLCSFIDSEPFLKYQNSKFGKRPPEYLSLKKSYCDFFLSDLVEFVPELENNINQVYTSSPVTNEHFTGSYSGSSFGISHDIECQGIKRPSPRTRIKNLFFSGQSIHLPGVCGVAINAFQTCGIILGESYLFEKVTRSS